LLNNRREVLVLLSTQSNCLLLNPIVGFNLPDLLSCTQINIMILLNKMIVTLVLNKKYVLIPIRNLEDCIIHIHP
jgi:hypothetical protein